MEEGLLESFVEIVQKMMDRDYIRVSWFIDSFESEPSELWHCLLKSLFTQDYNPNRNPCHQMSIVCICHPNVTVYKDSQLQHEYNLLLFNQSNGTAVYLYKGCHTLVVVFSNNNSYMLFGFSLGCMFLFDSNL